ncbi:MAG TPA: pantoate--beta-alanine ligase [Baekduia sp.]|nr:pantoate--beta-alanine ligase [Baekduia sp.]
MSTTTLVRTTAELRDELARVRDSGLTVGFVPTMGALHDGHLSLIAEAARQTDVVVTSVFVNPKQFGSASDLELYPRTLDADVELAATAGPAIVFAPAVDEIYPEGFATKVMVGGELTETLEGAQRGPEHFHGVTTVVTKLLVAVSPDVAVFGAKDAQQLLVIERLVRDLGLPVRIVSGPTVRESDGLAMSSRNVRLTAEARRRAVGLSKALFAAADAAAAGATASDDVLAPARAVLAQHDISPEYLALCSAATLTELSSISESDRALVLVAADFDGVRLIDNVFLSHNHQPEH